MSMEPEYETYDYTGEIARCKGQSVVECRLSGVGEIVSVLAVQARVAPLSSQALDGEARYGGKLFLSVVYEDGEKHVCRMERGVEFSHKVSNDLVTPSHTLALSLSVANSTVRREGASLLVSCIVDAEIVARGTGSIRFLTGGESIVCQKREQTFLREYYGGGEWEVSDEFACEHLSDVLMHGECVSVQKVRAVTGGVVVVGEVAVHICALVSDGLTNFERLLPFKAELPVSNASEGMCASVDVSVSDANVTLASDEEGGKSKISIAVTLSAQATVFEEERVFPALDAFGTEHELSLIKEKKECEFVSSTDYFCERVSGIASLSSPIDYSCSLQALVLQSVESSCRQEGGREELQGIARAVLLLTESDGLHRSVEVQLPFAIPMPAGGGRKEASVLVCGMSVRQKREGEAEVDATLKITVKNYAVKETEYVSVAQQGKPIERTDSAFSIFLPQAGDTLWEIAKSLKKHPDEVERDNPSLVFPVKKGERIIVYRQCR